MGQAEPQIHERRAGPRRRVDRDLAEARRVRGRLVLAAMVGGVGVLLSMLVAAGLWAGATRADHARFSTLCDRLEGEMTRRVEVYGHGLMAARSVFAASKSVERAEFAALVASRELASEFPGALGIGYIARVRRQDLASYLESVRSDGAPGFTISRDHGGEALYVIQYIEPLESNAGALGLDIASEDSQRHAAKAAMRTGEATVTAPIRLEQAEGQRPGFVYLLPVYRNGAPAGTEGERVESLAGWVYMPVVADAMFRGTSSIAEGQIDFQVFDAEYSHRGEVLYDDGGRPPRASTDLGGRVTEADFRDRRHHELREVHLGGRTWVVAMSTTPRFEVTPRTPALLVGVGGGLFSLLLGGVLYLQSEALRRARRLAESMTGDLRRLAVVAERTTNAVIITDTRRRIVWVNEGFTRISGYRPEDVLGRVPGKVLQCERTDPETVRAMAVALDQGHAFRGEILNRGKDGREYWLDIDIQPLRDERGEVTGFMAVESDITAIVEQRRALASGEARFRSMVEGADVIVWELDVDAGAFTYVSPRALSLGYTIDQWKRPGFWQEHLHPDDLDQADAFCKGQVEQGRAHRFQYRMVCADGRHAWIDDFVSAPEIVDGRMMLRGVMVDVTERVRAQCEIAELKERFEAAIDGTSDGLWDWRLDTDRAWYSPRVWAMLGYATDQAPESTRKSLLAHVHPDDMPRLERTLARHESGDEPLDAEVRLRLADGSHRWFRLRGDSRRDERGAIVRMSGSIQDVHEKREADEALRTAQERWSFALTGSGDGVWDWDVAAGTVSYSARWKSMFGFDEHEIGDSLEEWSGRVHPEDYPATLEDVKAHFEGRTAVYRNEHRVRCKDGSWKWILDRGMVVRRDPAGKPLRMVGTHTDISEMKRLQQETAATARDLAGAIASLEEAQAVARMGNWTFDLATGKVTWSRQLYTLYGRSEEEGPPDYEGVLWDYDEPSAALLDQAVQRAIADGQEYRLDLRTREQDGGGRYIRAHGKPRRNESGKVIGLFGTAMDVTTEVEREQRLLEAQALAEAASRAKSEFLANMSHEIRTPMTAILGYADLLEGDGDKALAPQERREYIETIKRNGQHLLTIINDILDLSKIEAGKMGIEQIETDPIAVARDVLDLMRIKAEAKGLDLHLEFEGPVPASIQSDPVRLRQILVNLVGNAIKFTTAGGVTLRIGMAAGAPPALRFEVEDTGVGIPKEMLGRLFGAFDQADTSTTRKFGGTGLGLRISRRLAEMLGGDIQVDSRPGLGSKFCLTVRAVIVPGAGMVHPAAGRPETPAPSRPETADADAPLRGLRILVAEDGPDNQRLIAFHLRKAGASLVVVGNGRLAIDAVQGDPAGFHAVLMDMQMPEMDGYTAASTLRSRGHDLPIVALTAHAMAGDRERCISAGCSGYLTKPIDRHALCRTLTELCRAPAAPRRAASGDRGRAYSIVPRSTIAATPK